MSRTTFSNSLQLTELMLDGIRSHQSQWAAEGLDPVLVNDLETIHQQVLILDKEDEELKARQKEHTYQLGLAYANMVAKLAEAKRRVKSELPPTRWKEFGIADQQ